MTADLQARFDQAGRNPSTPGLDADTVLRRARARRSRNRRITGAVAATVAVIVALGLGLASQRLLSADPVPAAPLPTASSITAPALGSLGRLAYGSNGDIYVADADGGNPVRIADGAPGKPGNCAGFWGEGPLWSPDGRYLAYRGGPTGGDASPTAVSCNRTVNISTADGQRVTSFPGDGWAVVWSPDSTRVAAWIDFYGDHTLGVYGLDGVRQALLTVPPRLMPSGDFDPVWSPDGATLLMKNGVEIPVDGSTPRELPADDPQSQWKAAYSPDGAHIAAISQDAVLGGILVTGGLTVSAADGSQSRVLIPGAVEGYQAAWAGLVWSPTGDRIAFAYQTDGGSTELRVVDVASGAVVSLADMSGAEVLGVIKFSPEGDQILFTKPGATGATSLWSVHADGSDPHQLVDGTGWGDWQTLIPTR